MRKVLAGVRHPVGGAAQRSSQRLDGTFHSSDPIAIPETHVSGYATRRGVRGLESGNCRRDYSPSNSELRSHLVGLHALKTPRPEAGTAGGRERQSEAEEFDFRGKENSNGDRCINRQSNDHGS